MTEPPDVEAPVRDRRRPPFCYQTLDALALIRSALTGSKRSTGLGVYLTLTEVANEKGGADARGGFQATRAEIAGLAGVSLDTLDRYVREFTKLGIVEVQHHKIGTVNLPNTWVLVDSPSAPPSRTGGVLQAAPEGHNARDPLPEVKKTSEEEVQRVYDHWRTARAKTRATYDTVSPGRAQKIRSRLREFTTDDLCRAIDGVAYDPWADRHLHDDLTVILRSREQVEKFLDLHASHDDLPPLLDLGFPSAERNA